TTQIENPRTQWRQEQERMLKEYLVVAQEALNAKKEMYLVKQQRLELAQQEMLRLDELSGDNHSITSSKARHCLPSECMYSPTLCKMGWREWSGEKRMNLRILCEQTLS
ncbi:Protein wwc3, partial [Xenoophorus captivus]